MSKSTKISGFAVVRTLLAKDWEYAVKAGKPKPHGPAAKARINKVRKRLPAHPTNDNFSETGKSIYLTDSFGDATLAIRLHDKLTYNEISKIEKNSDLSFLDKT